METIVHKVKETFENIQMFIPNYQSEICKIYSLTQCYRKQATTKIVIKDVVNRKQRTIYAL